MTAGAAPLPRAHPSGATHPCELHRPTATLPHNRPHEAGSRLRRSSINHEFELVWAPRCLGAPRPRHPAPRRPRVAVRAPARRRHALPHCRQTPRAVRQSPARSSHATRSGPPDGAPDSRHGRRVVPHTHRCHIVFRLAPAGADPRRSRPEHLGFAGRPHEDRRDRTKSPTNSTYVSRETHCAGNHNRSPPPGSDGSLDPAMPRPCDHPREDAWIGSSRILRRDTHALLL